MVLKPSQCLLVHLYKEMPLVSEQILFAKMRQNIIIATKLVFILIDGIFFILSIDIIIRTLAGTLCTFIII